MGIRIDASPQGIRVDLGKDTPDGEVYEPVVEVRGFSRKQLAAGALDLAAKALRIASDKIREEEKDDAGE